MQIKEISGFLPNYQIGIKCLQLSSDERSHHEEIINILPIRKFIKSYDESMKSYFRERIPAYAKILNKNIGIDTDIIKTKLESYL